ncbi:MAG: hypothetical protein ACKO0V_22510, partial [bacterium]
MKIQRLICAIAAGALFVQTVEAQQSKGNQGGGNGGQQGGGRGNRGGGGPGGPGGGGPGGPGGPGGMGAMRGFMGGGAGGMMGRLGNSPAMLIRSEAVQKELKFTDEQKEKLKKADDAQNDKRQKAFEDLRNQGGNNDQQGGRGGRGGGIDFNAMRGMMEKMAKDAESDLAKILTADQRKRLAEIALQVEGATAILDREDIAKKLNITPVQKNKLMQIKQQADQKQQDLRSQAMAGFGFG